jgi:hypothetical protein
MGSYKLPSALSEYSTSTKPGPAGHTWSRLAVHHPITVVLEGRRTPQVKAALRLAFRSSFVTARLDKGLPPLSCRLARHTKGKPRAQARGFQAHKNHRYSSSAGGPSCETAATSAPE